MTEVRAQNVVSSENINFSLMSENNLNGSDVSNTNKSDTCVLCGTDVAEAVTDAAGLGKMDIFGRLSPAFDVIIINKLASVTGRTAAELHSRGNHICSGCHGRVLKLHAMETSADQERAVLSELYRRSCAARPTRPGADPLTSAPPPPGASLLLVNDVEVRLQDDQVTAVPLTSTRRRQLLRQARSAERRFQCKVCGKRFRAFSHRVEHMLIHVNESPWACELCHKTFRTKSARTAHQRVHAPAEPRFTCPVCDRQLSDAASLKAHARTHDPDKPYTCDKCGRRFARRKDYAVHARLHTGERPHECPDCSKTFVARSRLNRHRLLHRDKQFVCACNRAFRRRYELQRHIKGCAHSGVATTEAAAAVGATAAVAVGTVETTDPAIPTQAAAQPTTLTCLPLVQLPDAVSSAVYYQVVTPVAAVGPAPLADGGAAEAVVQQPAPQEQPPQQQLPVVTY